MKSKNKIIKTAVICFALILILIAVCWQGLTVNYYRFTSDKLNAAIKAVLIADLHSSKYGKDQKNLIKAIDGENPDIIFLAGDIVDDEAAREPAEQLLRYIGEKYPCYYVCGNHECWSGDLEGIESMIKDCGITVIEGNSERVELNGRTLLVAGLSDPDALGVGEFVGGAFTDPHKEEIERIKSENGGDVYSVLLSHRPELVEDYKYCGYDLVLCGHAHGGQVIIPFIGQGIYAPNQGFLPKYTSGVHELSGSSMLVSRGLCRNLIPRVFNPPELIVIEISPK